METVFVNGIRFYKPNEKAPEFILANVDIDVVQLNLFLEEHANGTGKVRATLKKGKSGAIYMALDTYKRDVVPEPSESSPF